MRLDHFLSLAVFFCISGLITHEALASDAITCQDGDPTERLVACTRLLEAKKVSGKDLAHIYDNRGMGYVMLGRMDNGIDDFDKAIAIYPGLATAYLNRAYAYIFSENMIRAAADFERAMEAKPDWAAPYVGRAILHFMRGFSQDAIADLTKGISIDPYHAQAYLNRGVLYREQGQIAKAVADFKMTVRLDPFNSAARQQLKELSAKPDVENRLPNDRVGKLNEGRTLMIGRGRSSVQCTILRRKAKQHRYACLFSKVSN